MYDIVPKPGSEAQAAELARLRAENARLAAELAVANTERDNTAEYATGKIEAFGADIARARKRGDTYRARARACHQNAVKARLLRIDFDLLSDTCRELHHDLAEQTRRADALAAELAELRAWAREYWGPQEHLNGCVALTTDTPLCNCGWNKLAALLPGAGENTKGE